MKILILFMALLMSFIVNVKELTPNVINADGNENTNAGGVSLVKPGIIHIGELPSDLAICTGKNAQKNLIKSLNVIGNKIGYSNLSSRMEKSSVENFLTELNSRSTDGKNGQGRGKISYDFDTEIDDTGFFDDTDIKITTEVYGLDIDAPDDQVNSYSFINGYGVKNKVTWNNGMTYNLYTAKIYVKTTVTTLNSMRSPVKVSNTTSFTGTASTTINFYIAERLR